MIIALAPEAYFALAFAGMVVLVLLIALVSFVSLLRPWLRGFLAGVPLTIFHLIGMRLRGVPAGLAVDALVTLAHRGHRHGPERIRQVESTYLARRGTIHSPEQLADLVEKEIQAKSGA